MIDNFVEFEGDGWVICEKLDARDFEKKITELSEKIKEFRDF